MSSPKSANSKTTGQNGSSVLSPKQTATGVSRKERRKEWAIQHKKIDQQASHTASKPTQDNASEEPVNQRTKLRNRETIPKPDSLQYVPNQGFQPKFIQDVHLEVARKVKSKSKTKKPTTPSAGKGVKRSSENVSAGSPAKKPKPAPVVENEIFDSYAFSMKLINGDVEKATADKAKDSNNKYVLFIGNLPHDVTREQLEEHFRKAGGIKAIRIPREKSNDKGRGFAYMEFDGRISHGMALRLHHTTLGGRKINVEFTSIGGGKSKARREKLQKKNSQRKKMKMH